MSLVHGHTYWLILAWYAVISCQLPSLNMAKFTSTSASIAFLTGGDLRNIARFLKVNRRGLGNELILWYAHTSQSVLTFVNNRAASKSTFVDAIP